MLKNPILNSPVFWATVILGVYAFGTTSMMPAGTLRRLAFQLAAYL